MFIIESKEEIRTRLTSLYDYEKVGCPFREGDRYFFFKNSGLQNQSVLYYKDSLDGNENVFVDPNEWSEDGTTAISTLSFTNDGSLVVFGISEKGSDWKSGIY